MSLSGALSRPHRPEPRPTFLGLSSRLQSTPPGAVRRADHAGPPSSTLDIRAVRVRRKVSVIGVAIGEMAKWREDIVPAVTADGSDDIALLARQSVGAFHQRQITVAGGAQQRVEVGAGVIGDSHSSLLKTK